MLRNAILDALAILAPVPCAGCDAPDRGVCETCAPHLQAQVAVRSPHGIPVHTALRYELVVRRILLAYKEHGRTDLARRLAVPLGAAIEAGFDAAARAGHAGVELVPVPTSRSAFRRRGYDPVRLLLRSGGWRCARVLRAARASSAQKALGLAERAANRDGAFTARTRLDGRTVLLVDDVLTSGATLADAARAVREAGGTVAGAVTLAFTPRIHPTRDIPR